MSASQDASSKRYLLGVDLGTTKAKTGLFDLEGNLVHLGEGTYPIHTDGGPGWAEQDPDDWWQVVCACIRRVTRRIRPDEIAAVCVGGQGPTLVMVDQVGQPLLGALSWMDNRSIVEQRELSERLGQPLSPYSYLPKAMWLRRHRPDLYRRAKWFLSAWDFIAFRLSGRAVASCFGAYDPFPMHQMEAAGLEPGLAPPLLQVGTRVGGLTEAAYAATGLKKGLPVVAGVNDGMETVIGAGITAAGRAVDTGGTAGGFALCWNEAVQVKGLHSGPAILPGQVIIGGSMSALGKAFDWYIEALEPKGTTHEQVIRRAANIPIGAGELIFLPYLAGERSPVWDPRARGVFFGLSLRHRRDHLARAVLESAAYALRHVAEPVLEAGVNIVELRVCGGQARSQFWNQMKADAANLIVAVPRVTEAALLGAAALAGVGSEVFPDIPSSVDKMVHIEESLHPDPERHHEYTHYFSLYKRLYPDLRQAFHEMNALSLAVGP